MQKHSDDNKKQTLHDYLTIIQLLGFMITAIWVFAFLQADVNVIKKDVDSLEKNVEKLEVESQRKYVRQDVFLEQYRQIIEGINENQQGIDDIKKRLRDNEY